MRLTNYLFNSIKEDPSEAQIVSHKLMLRSGMIKLSSSGIYSWLPLGLKVLKKIENIVRVEQEAAGAIEVLMPTIQPADIWLESGRYKDYGREMLRLKDRHDREMLYGPTNEELITKLFSSEISSYKELPKNLFQIQWKFRDELRPRFGVMRGREFLMKDAYSFDLNEKMARISYNKMFISYLRTFYKMGLKAIPMHADSGPIGGNMSHEFLILADTGESKVHCHKKLLNMKIPDDNYADDKYVQNEVNIWTSYYAATDDKYDSELFEKTVPESSRIKSNGIEVGHIFFFGTKYSEKLGAYVNDANGKNIPAQMGSYGIGISRLVGAIIEANHDEKGIIWPAEVAPFNIGLINLNTDLDNCINISDKIYNHLMSQNIEVLYDDRNIRSGSKLKDIDLIGLPKQIIIGPRSVSQGYVEVKDRKTGALEKKNLEELLIEIPDKK